MFRDKTRYGQDPTRVHVSSKQTFNMPISAKAKREWKPGDRVFVCSWSDFFHEEIDDDTRDEAISIMIKRPDLTFLILTKRPERMRDYMRGCQAGADDIGGEFPWRNIHLGVTAENQKWFDKRVPILLDTPAVARFVSVEPMLGPMDIKWMLSPTTRTHTSASVDGMIRNRAFDCFQNEDGSLMSSDDAQNELMGLHANGVKCIPCGPKCDGFSDDDGCPGHRVPALDLVIVGGESGPEPREMNLEWARSIRDQCAAAGVPFFFKQVSAFRPKDDMIPDDLRIRQFPEGE